MKKLLSLTVCLLFVLSQIMAQLSVPSFFSDHMVLQREKPINIWGTASAGERISVTLGNAQKSTRTDKNGKWSVSLPPMQAGGPYTLNVKSLKQTLSFTDILIGEVWICSGQSNMEFRLRSANHATEEVAAANYPQIRSFNVIQEMGHTPKTDLKGKWEVCSPASASDFSAVGYFFARELYQKLNIPILLGSATPSLESVNNVQNGKYHHLVLSKRAGNATALRQFVIDLKHQRIQNGLSEPLLKRMQEHLEKGNQVLLFLNRRGFAPVLLCHECGWIDECHHCEKPYTYHQHQRVLRCHHCGAQKTVPMQCGHCGSTHLVTTGLGTEQLEETLKARFPQYNIARIDRDSTARKGKLEGYLEDIQQGKSQILIGTQMLAKGHHFPNVTLVALVNVDNALFSLDFRAEERLAQLYVQVAGRSGRAEKQGEVVLQTHYPDHPLLTTLLEKGYQAFAEETLKLRHNMGLPPFSFQALFKAQCRHSEEAENALSQLASFFYEQKIEDLQVLGPIPAPFSKKAGQYRWQLLLQHASRKQLQAALSRYSPELIKSSQVRLILDVDPLDLS